MFENLRWRTLLPNREPVLYAWLVVAVATVVARLLGGELDLMTAAGAVVQLVVAFVVRGQVTPEANLRATDALR